MIRISYDMWLVCIIYKEHGIYALMNYHWCFFYAQNYNFQRRCDTND